MESEDLTNQLYRRFATDQGFKERLAASNGLPADMRTIINGGNVERLIQIAQAGTVNIHYGTPIWLILLLTSIVTLPFKEAEALDFKKPD